MYTLLILVAVAWANEIQEDDLKFKTHHEKIPNTNYEIYTNQTLTLTYEA